MLAERPLRLDGPLQNDAWLGHGRSYHVRIVALLRRVLVKEIAVGSMKSEMNTPCKGNSIKSLNALQICSLRSIRGAGKSIALK
jgi:hypothetical protein